MVPVPVPTFNKLRFRFRFHQSKSYGSYGSGSGSGSGSTTLIRIGTQDKHPGSYFRELSNIFLGQKYLNASLRIRIRNPGPFQTLESGIWDGKIRIQDKHQTSILKASPIIYFSPICFQLNLVKGQLNGDSCQKFKTSRGSYLDLEVSIFIKIIEFQLVAKFLSSQCFGMWIESISGSRTGSDHYCLKNLYRLFRIVAEA